MSYKNLIALHKKVIPHNLCKKTTRFFDHNNSYNSNIATNEGWGVQKEMRNSKEITLYWGEGEDGDLCRELYSVIYPLVDEYFDKYVQLFADTGPTHYEEAHILRYEPNTGYYNFHFDTRGEGIDNRLVTIIMYLNDVEEGGETEFEYIDINPIRPRRGDVVIFPSGATHTHRGNMPLSNAKYICVFWLREDIK